MKKIFIQLIIFVLMLFSVGVFAMGINETDKSAFISKSEFDAIKNNLNNQLDQFNTRVDSKIDIAIANYLSGITLDNEILLLNNTSILEYPLSIHNFESDLTRIKWNNQTASNRWWVPNENFWGVYGFGQSGDSAWAENDIITFDYQPYENNRIKSFYNIKNIDSSNRAIIDGVMENFKLVINHRGLLHTRDDWFPTKSYYGYILNESQTASTYVSGANNFNFTNLRATGVGLYRSDSYPSNMSLVTYFSNGNQNASSSFNFANNYERVNNGGSWYQNLTNSTYPSFWRNDSVTVTYEINNKLNNLWNCNRTSSYIPVSYNSVVYYTNKKELKYNVLASSLSSNTVTCWRNCANGYYQSNARWFGYIDNGWVLEPEGAGISTNRNWNNMSLINHNHLYYEVNPIISNGQYYMSILDGIFLTEIPTGDYKLAKLVIDISDSDETLPKYIVISKSPISIYKTNDVTGNNFFDLYKTKKLDGEYSKLFKLKNGTNEIYFKNIRENDKIFVKVIWDANNWDGDDYNVVTINSIPNLYITKDI